jgi:hypothetical protein
MDAVREILLRDWDPLNVRENEQCRDEYDRYALAIVKLLRSGADAFKLSATLANFEQHSMGLPRPSEERQHCVAKLLLSAASSASSRLQARNQLAIAF